MGRDNQPKERQRKHLQRKLNQRASYDRILMVSEGTKTEPNYFNELRSTYRLRTTNVVVTSCEYGTAPLQVVEYAKELFISGDAHRRIQPRAFEKVFAVFDRDDHRTYFPALDLADSLDGKLQNDERKTITFKSIASVPCFEIWLLLHFEDIHAPIGRNEVFERLKKYMPDYEKGANGTFAATANNLQSALDAAKRLSEHFNAYNAPEPYTGIYELVSLLINLGS